MSSEMIAYKFWRKKIIKKTWKDTQNEFLSSKSTDMKIFHLFEEIWKTWTNNIQIWDIQNPKC